MKEGKVAKAVGGWEIAEGGIVELSLGERALF